MKMEQRKKKGDTMRQSQEEVVQEDTVWQKIKNHITQFFAKHYKVILSVSALVLMGFLFKKKFYNCMVPQSDIMTMINERALKQVVVGSMFMYGYLKTPGLSNYVISNRSLIEDKQIIETL